MTVHFERKKDVQTTKELEQTKISLIQNAWASQQISPKFGDEETFFIFHLYNLPREA